MVKHYPLSNDKNLKSRLIHWVLGAGAQEPGAWKGSDKLDVTRFSLDPPVQRGSVDLLHPGARNKRKPALPELLLFELDDSQEETIRKARQIFEEKQWGGEIIESRSEDRQGKLQSHEFQVYYKLGFHEVCGKVANDFAEKTADSRGHAVEISFLITVIIGEDSWICVPIQKVVVVSTKDPIHHLKSRKNQGNSSAMSK
ncbi:hypothetical protein TNCV_4521841 [Trichonephila clavipes]|nr:hypothetical protein TNCV_4521841 [Trichonephila clavipes]